jgi:hypothetical protein
MGEIEAAHVAHREFAEHVVEDRGRHLDRVVALHRARGSKRVKVKASTYSSSGTPYCRPSEIAIAKLFMKRAQRRAFLVHVDEDLAEAAVVVFAGAQIDLVAADHGLLGVALAAVGQLLALARDDALDDALDDSRRDARARRGLREAPRPSSSSSSSSDELRVERLRELRAVAIERVGLERELPGQQ